MFKQIFCEHQYEWVRNIHGDEINMAGGKRSWRGCHKCGKSQLKEVSEYIDWQENTLYVRDRKVPFANLCNRFLGIKRNNYQNKENLFEKKVFIRRKLKIFKRKLKWGSFYEKKKLNKIKLTFE